VRVTDVKVLDAPMERVTGEVRSPGGVTGTGSVFAINHNADNALATLRYRFAKADFQIAEESFEAAGKRFARGSFIVKGVPQADLDKAAKELGVQAVALAAAPNVKAHPARAARVAILHTWLGTQTEGWWRQAFDVLSIPFDYISTQDVAKNPNLNAKYDVILFPPTSGNGTAIIQGMPLWRNPVPWKNSSETPNISTLAQTDDMRPGLGWQGLENLESFVAKGGVLVTVANTAEFAVQFGLTNGVTANSAKSNSVVGSLLRTKRVDETSPIVYGVSDNLAVYSDDGGSFSVSSTRGGRGGFGGGGGASGRATGRGTADDPDVTQGTLGGSEVRRAAARDGAAVAGRADHRRHVAEPDQHHSAGSASARVVALCGSKGAARVGSAGRGLRRRAAAGGGGRPDAEGARGACSRTIRCGGARRSAAMRSCSTRC
jgi:hypothetical protein